MSASRRSPRLNLAHMIPLSAVWAGPARNDHLDGPPLIFADTEGATPFRFSTHVGDVGHTLVVGPTGAGKSVLLALMALQFRRYEGAQVFAFDFGGSIRCAALAMGGDWQDLAGGLSEDDDAVELQPLAGIDAIDRAELGARLARCPDRARGRASRSRREGASLVGADLARLGAGRGAHADRALGAAAIDSAEARAGAVLPRRAVRAAARRRSEALGDASVQAFETEGLIGTAAAPAVLGYLFHRIEARLDGRPSLIIIDEGWLALDETSWRGQLRDWLKTLRKKNASVIFATQSLADIDGSAIAPAIVESCPTRIYLANERALEPQIAAIYARFGLNARQIEIVANATPKRDYYCQSRRGNRLFELGLGEIALAFTAVSSKTDQAAIAATLAAHGKPGFAAAWLARRGLDWAVELLEPNRDSEPAAAAGEIAR